LEKKGFNLARQSGSHKIYKNSSGIRMTIPDHTGKILHPGILRQICKDAGISPDELS
jgi:predicted RNA binding protein YcfA (HicA-like mRNA interferase family)